MTTLAKDGGHPNIVLALHHGALSRHQYYFDMELCDLTLHEYIHGTRPEEIVNAVANLGDPLKTTFAEVTFVNKESGLETTLLNIWTIMSHVAAGLEFMHERGQVHRDLKPKNSEYATMSELNL